MKSQRFFFSIVAVVVVLGVFFFFFFGFVKPRFQSAVGRVSDVQVAAVVNVVPVPEVVGAVNVERVVSNSLAVVNAVEVERLSVVG